MKTGKRILIILFVIQLIFPGAIAIAGEKNRRDFPEKAKEIKVKVNEITYNIMEDTVSISIDDFSQEVLFAGSFGGYFVFEETEKGSGLYIANFSETRPNHPLFVKRKFDYIVLGEEYELKNDKFSDYFASIDLPFIMALSIFTDDRSVFVPAITESTVSEAYAVFRVYNGIYEQIEVYVDDIPLNEYTEMVADGKVDLTAFNMQLDEINDEYLEKDYPLLEDYTEPEEYTDSEGNIL